MVLKRRVCPPSLEICKLSLHFHFLGKCKMGVRCRKANSHIPLKHRDETKFTDWLRGLEQPAPTVLDGFPPRNNDRMNDMGRDVEDRGRDNVRDGGSQECHPNGRDYTTGPRLVQR